MGSRRGQGLRLGPEGLLALDNNELNSLAFFQRAVAITHNGAEVYKHIFAIVPRDEAKTFGGVNPL